MATATPTPGDDRRREMSPDEKLIAQWEAQHDVAARGHRGDPLGLQRSITRERLADCARRTSSAPGTGRGSTASRPTVDRPTVDRPAVDRPEDVRGAEDADWSAVCAVPPSSLPPASSSEPPPPSSSERPARRHPWWRLRHHTSER